MHKLKLIAPEDFSGGKVVLEGSKSISNRVLIIRALSDSEFEVKNLSPSNDTNTLNSLLSEKGNTLDAGAAGTTFRFLTAWLSRSNKRQILLTGSERMKQRPIGILTNALKTLGADISYVEKEGYPPLLISGKTLQGGPLKISASVSSQYISALLMIGPSLKDGLALTLEGKVGSRPYIEMTLRIMEHFGAKWSWKADTIYIEEGNYTAQLFTVEGDWSAASYYYGLAAVVTQGNTIEVEGLNKLSLQGDSVLPSIYNKLGIQTVFTDSGIEITRTAAPDSIFEFDFSDCPDLAQTVVVTCAILGVKMRINGLESLRIKETDRTAALSKELALFGIAFEDKGMGYWELEGKAEAPDQTGLIHTYEDHRMAMAFAPLSFAFGAISFEEPDVVRKSYPSFWEDWQSLGFEIE
ncbi:MAG: 3-phosphoshikimate 1-carboxyvinyltransferase [Limisphaerales bacterium]|jgi:3-phosphoshikimate 1-carboxyvinyltransferase